MRVSLVSCVFSGFIMIFIRMFSHVFLSRVFHMLSPFFEFVQFLCNSFEVMVANQQCRRKGIAREAVQLMQAGARIR